MSWEQGTFVVGLLVLIAQGFQTWVTMGLKLWANDKFVAKTDFGMYHDAASWETRHVHRPD